MAKKYGILKIPLITKQKLSMKKISMEKRWKELTGIKKKLPYSRLIDIISNKKIFIEDNELKKYFNRRKR